MPVKDSEEDVYHDLLATKYHNFVRSVSTTGNSLAYDEYLGFSTAVKDLQFSFQLSESPSTSQV